MNSETPMQTFKITIQPDAMDCGPACLRMIAEHYGHHYDLDVLRKWCNIGREGVSLLGISKAAEQMGFRTVGGRLTYDTLKDRAVLPCVAHWDQEHFVVVYGIRGEKIQVADPCIGFVEYTRLEFCNHWVSTRTFGEEKGVVLLLEPTKLFYDKEDIIVGRQNRVNFLFSYFMQYKRYFLQLILGLLLGSLLQLVFPFLTQSLVDTGINGQDISFVWLILFAELMLLTSQTVVSFIRRRLLLHISTRINISLISDFIIKLMRLPMAFFDTKMLGDIMQRIDDHRRIEQFLTAQTLNLMFSIFSFLVFGVVLLLYNSYIFIAFIIGSILYAAWLFVFLRRRRVLDFKYFGLSAKGQSVIFELIAGMQETKLHGCEQRKRWQWEDVQAELFGLNMESLSLQQTQEVGSFCINELKNIVVTILAASAVINGSMTLGMMLAVQYIVGQLAGPAEQLANFIYQWQDVSISLERMSEIHTRKNEENEKRTRITTHGQNIRLYNVSFHYDGSRTADILKSITLEIPAGKTTAIVGASGSGKTTLVKLLLGYYTPQSGTITVGDDDLSTFNLSWWRSQCGVVMQDGFIYSESIARNIAPAGDEIDIERMRQAARTACIADYIESLPLNYNTIIGRDGQGLSQGQKQRILIARAVYRNPKYIFLDEATNSLDADNERQITEGLEQFYRGKTVVIVAHRLSTVRNADNIIVLERGHIVEQGTHNELTSKHGRYYELVRNQLELGN